MSWVTQQDIARGMLSSAFSMHRRVQAPYFPDCQYQCWSGACCVLCRAAVYLSTASDSASWLSQLQNVPEDAHADAMTLPHSCQLILENCGLLTTLHIVRKDFANSLKHVPSQAHVTEITMLGDVTQ